jgi:hypothetical protein
MDQNSAGSILSRNKRRRMQGESARRLGEHRQCIGISLLLGGFMLLLSVIFLYAAWDTAYAPPRDLNGLKFTSLLFKSLHVQYQIAFWLLVSCMCAGLGLGSLWMLVFRRGSLIFSQDGIAFGRGRERMQFAEWHEMSSIQVGRGMAWISYDARSLSVPFFLYGLWSRSFLEEIEHHRPDLVTDLLREYR